MNPYLRNSHKHCCSLLGQLLLKVRVGVCVLLLAGTFCGGSTSFAEEQNSGLPRVFRAGFLSQIFINTDPRDVEAVLDVHTRKIARAMKLKTTTEVTIFASLEDMIEAVFNQKLDLVTLPGLDYLRVRDMATMIPAFVGIHNSGPGINYVLIARNAAGIRSLSDLKGKSIIIPKAVHNEPSHLWLDVLLKRIGEKELSGFFSHVKESPKLSQGVMSVFFGRVDAAIVTHDGLELARELNPQLETQLIVLAESPNLNDSVTCLFPTTPDNFRQDVYQALLGLNESKTGKQMYTIFQTKGITPFKPEHLEGLEVLLDEQQGFKIKMSVGE